MCCECYRVSHKLATKSEKSVKENSRFPILQAWVAERLGGEAAAAIVLMRGDASFRHYYRIVIKNDRWVLMDAPPEQAPASWQRGRAFLQLTEWFAGLGVRVPTVHAADESLGLFLLTDFGDELYLSALQHQDPSPFYGKAIDTLCRIQHSARPDFVSDFSAMAYWNEYQLFTEHYWPLIGLAPSAREVEAVAKNYQQLIDVAQEQPQVLVHRDYHSRNLMCLDNGEVGVLDFQDALFGPITYDMVSLLRDCYIDWPEAQLEAWLRDIHGRWYREGLLSEQDFPLFKQWFDWMGLQRHIKCLGIFARLQRCYNKPGYLQYLPRVLAYAQSVANCYQELDDLAQLLAQCQVRQQQGVLT